MACQSISGQFEAGARYLWVVVLRLWLLDAFRLEHEDGSDVHTTEHRLRALLAFLALNPYWHSRRRLADELWGADDESAQRSVKEAISQLRRGLLNDRRPFVVLLTNAEGTAYRLATSAASGATIRVDVEDLDTLIEAGSGREAFALAGHGDLLPDFGPSTWLEEARAEHRRRLAGLLDLAEAHVPQDRVAEARERLLREEPAPLRGIRWTEEQTPPRASASSSAGRSARPPIPVLRVVGVLAAMLAVLGAFVLLDAASRGRLDREGTACRPERLTVLDPRDAEIARRPERAGRRHSTSVGTRPSALAIGREGVWVGQRNGIVLVDPTTREQVGQAIDVGGKVYSLALTRRRLWATRRDGRLVSVDRLQRRRVGPVVHYGRMGGTVQIAHGDVWVNSYLDGNDDRYDGRVARIDPCSGRIRFIRVGQEADSLLAAFGSVWVTDAADARVVRLSARSGGILATISGVTDPQDLVAADGSIWVTDYVKRRIRRIDPRRNRIASGAFRVGTDPGGVASGFGALWVPSYADSTMTRVDLVRHRSSSAGTTGLDPVDVAVGFGRVWTADNGADTITSLGPAAPR